MKDHLYNGEVAYKIGYGNDYNNYLLNKYKLSSTYLYNNMLDSTSLPCGLISRLEHQIDTHFFKLGDMKTINYTL